MVRSKFLSSYLPSFLPFLSSLRARCSRTRLRGGSESEQIPKFSKADLDIRVISVHVAMRTLENESNDQTKIPGSTIFYEYSHETRVSRFQNIRVRNILRTCNILARTFTIGASYYQNTRGVRSLRVCAVYIRGRVFPMFQIIVCICYSLAM